MVVALVHSRLDYGNGVLVGLPTYLMHQLQSVLNAAARLIFHLKTSDHITDALVSLDWLWAPERIQYKLAVMAFKVLYGRGPSYLGPLVSVADVSGRRALRSAIGSRAFSVAGPRIWNSLFDDVVLSTKLCVDSSSRFSFREQTHVQSNRRSDWSFYPRLPATVAGKGYNE